jgi:hypothetical protein
MKKTFLAVMSVLCLGSADAIAPVAPNPAATVAVVDAELNARGIIGPGGRATGLYQAILNLGIDPTRYLTAVRNLNISSKTVADLIDIVSDQNQVGRKNTISVNGITPPTETAKRVAARALQAAVNVLDERKREEKDVKLDGVRLVYRNSHSVFTAFDAALRLFTAATLDAVAQAGGALNAALANVRHDLNAIQDQISGTNGGVGLVALGRITSPGGGTIADGAQQLHDDLAALHNTLNVALANIVRRSIDNRALNDHEALAILALVNDLRGWDEDLRDSIDFNRDELLTHLGQIGLTQADITAVKANLNASISRLHAGGNIPVYFVPVNRGNPGDVAEYQIP